MPQARERGAVDFAHWFFPLRGQGGAVGGMLGAYKQVLASALRSSGCFTNALWEFPKIRVPYFGVPNYKDPTS